MPKVFLKTIQKSLRGDIKSDQLPSLYKKKIQKNNKHDLSAHNDWSCVSTLSIVTRWELGKVPQSGPGRYDQPSRRLPLIKNKTPVAIDYSEGYNLRRNSKNNKYQVLKKCPDCHEAFDKAWILKFHIRLHTGKKRFFCPSCEKCFGDRSNLRAHQRIKSHHSWKWNCFFCSKPFSQRKYMEQHQTHCGIKLNNREIFQDSKVQYTIEL